MTAKARLQMVVVIVAALLLAMLLGIVVTRASAAEKVLWKQTCPAWADMTIIQEGMDRHYICSVGDAHDHTR
jgi:hypothetical protein